MLKTLKLLYKVGLVIFKLSSDRQKFVRVKKSRIGEGGGVEHSLLLLVNWKVLNAGHKNLRIFTLN